MKKALLILMSLLMALCLIFVSCDEEESSSMESETQSTSEQSSMESDSEKPISVTEVMLNERTLLLSIGEKATLIATVSPEDATNKEIVWLTSDESIATVENGVVTAISEGTATIMAVSSSGKSETCKVSVDKNLTMYEVIYDYDNGEKPLTEQVKENSLLTPKEPKKAGYTFIKWTVNGEEWDFEVDKVTSNITLSAVWEKASLTDFTYNKEKLAISVNDEITPELFDAVCLYDNGEKAIIETIVGGTKEAGKSISVRFVASDVDGNQNQLTIKNIKVYGTPTLEFDDKITTLNVNNLTKEYFSAQGVDTYGEATEINVEIDGKAGSTVKVTISSKDIAGNITYGHIKNVKAYDNPTLTYDEKKKEINETDTLNEALFSASATDTFGKECKVIVSSEKPLKKATEVKIILTATDEAGNITTKEISGVKVYGAPTIEIDEFLYEDTDINFMAVAYDSFGNELVTTITYTGAQTDGSKVTVTVKAQDDAGNRVEKSYEYIVNHDEHTYENGYCTACNAKQPYLRDGNTIYFGTYPQTEITDSTLKATLNSVVGTTPTSSNAQAWTSYGYYIDGSASNFMWYIDIEEGGEKYRGVYFTSYRPSDTTNSSSTSNSSQDNNGYTTNNIYWFKYEPISWTILNEDNGTALILCDMIIDCQQFNYENGSRYEDYERSTIRAWLNDNFYNTAFNDLQKKIILTTTVDNTSDNYAGNNTEDKVFLLNINEVTTYLTTDASRTKQTTDYAQSQGAGASDSGNGEWFVRSYNGSGSVRYITSGGLVAYVLGFPFFYVDFCETCGVVPTLQIQLCD